MVSNSNRLKSLPTRDIRKESLFILTAPRPVSGGWFKGQVTAEPSTLSTISDSFPDFAPLPRPRLKRQEASPRRAQGRVYRECALPALSAPTSLPRLTLRPPGFGKSTRISNGRDRLPCGGLLWSLRERVREIRGRTVKIADV